MISKGLVVIKLATDVGLEFELELKLGALLSEFVKILSMKEHLTLNLSKLWPLSPNLAGLRGMGYGREGRGRGGDNWIGRLCRHFNGLGSSNEAAAIELDTKKQGPYSSSKLQFFVGLRRNCKIFYKGRRRNVGDWARCGFQFKTSSALDWLLKEGGNPGFLSHVTESKHHVIRPMGRWRPSKQA